MKTINLKKGFTLVEIIVVMGFFSILMIAIFGIFISILRVQRYNLASQQLLDQSSYAMEYMSRFLRMAKKASGGDCITQGKNYEITRSGAGVMFQNYHYASGKYDCMEFYIENGILFQQISGDSPWPLTSVKINIVSSILFLALGDEEGKQPQLSILLDAQWSQNLNPSPKIKLQTTVSQRDLNL